jgi:hypothetical protein
VVIVVTTEAERHPRVIFAVLPIKRRTMAPLAAGANGRSSRGGNTMKKGLSVIAIASLLALPMGATAYAEVKEFIGEVVRVNLAKGILDLVKGGRHLRLAVRQGAVLLDEGGQPLKGLKDIQVGDYVRQECKVQEKGLCLATKINILKRAWQMEGSPEE